MTTKSISISSKNQITLPIEFVRKMQLDRNHVLVAEFHNGSIILKPQPALGQSLRHFWGKHQAKQPLSEDQLRQATRMVAAKRANSK